MMLTMIVIIIKELGYFWSLQFASLRQSNFDF